MSSKLESLSDLASPVAREPKRITLASGRSTRPALNGNPGRLTPYDQW